MKNLNELAIITFDKLLKLSDEEFYKYFESIQSSDLSSTLEYSGMFDTKGEENEKAQS